MGREKLRQSLLKMRDLAVPEPGFYGITPLKDAVMPDKLSNIFRVFSPIKPDKRRKPNAGYGFDSKVDVLSDSPITIAAKLDTQWENYNLHAIVQSGVCNFRCWYCYVDFKFLTGRNVIQVSGDEVFQQFIQLREEFKTRGQSLNVLRISGGEPMLVPDLTLTCLRLVKQKGLEKEICVKTETNLSPLVRFNGRSLAEEWASFEELSQYNNFLIHPTLHGIGVNSLQNNSAVSAEMFDVVCDGINTLLHYKLDFYPSFGANTVPIEEIKPFFDRLVSLNENLPLRFAVRPFSFDYHAVASRNRRRSILTFDHSQSIQVWDALLRERYGVRYAEIPRHQVPLYR